MKIADLYIRVSTDEQADKGYSQRNQDEILRKYCAINDIQVRKVIFEDHSAKTFNRPKWNLFLSDLRKHRGKSDIILFTKWDRFSRNAGDAYQMISMLRKFGIEPQAVEQHLDLSIPENKMMLAFYLAAPEVENDRRALNVFYGMRRAKKEGRWMGNAPVGYENKINEAGRKYIAPKEPEATIMKWVFQEIANGVFAADQVRKEANKKGLKCSRSVFWTTIRNPIYCGKINIVKYKDEEDQLVHGQHEPIISEMLFYEVQDVLSGRKRKTRSGTQIITHDSLPLRGFLICPRCGRTLTGSASKGNCYRYYYYHCISACGCRFKADNANQLFTKELKKYVPHSAMSELYAITICKAFKNQTSHQQSDRKLILNQLDGLNTRLKNAREMLADRKLDADDYREIKVDCTTRINELEARLTPSTEKPVDINQLITIAINTLKRLDCLYEDGTIEEKRKIISSIYPEKLIFDGFQYRTSRINEVARLIYTLDKGFREGPEIKTGEKSPDSGMVVPTGIEPVSKV